MGEELDSINPAGANIMLISGLSLLTLGVAGGVTGIVLAVNDDIYNTDDGFWPMVLIPPLVGVAGVVLTVIAAIRLPPINGRRTRLRQQIQDRRGEVGDDLLARPLGFHDVVEGQISLEAPDELAADHAGRADDQDLHQSGSHRRHHGTSDWRPPAFR